jgi:hypothetical protein
MSAILHARIGEFVSTVSTIMADVIFGARELRLSVASEFMRSGRGRGKAALNLTKESTLNKAFPLSGEVAEWLKAAVC